MERDEQYHISALKKGSRKSFKWLFDQYKTPVYSYIRSLLKSNRWTEDICSEVFIAVWNNRQKIKPESFRPYIFQIAKNRVFNKLKKVAADTQQEEEYIRLYRESSETENKKEEGFQTKQNLLKEEIEGLPPKRKEIIERKYFLGQKNAQIAKDMGISINTVKVQLYKAHIFLRSRMERKEGNI